MPAQTEATRRLDHTISNKQQVIKKIMLPLTPKHKVKRAMARRKIAYTKRATTYEDQIKILKQRGAVIADEEKVK